MKKFLSICLVALCSISAMYAQEEATTPNPSTDERTGVACGTEVKVEATAQNKHFHFDYWVIRDDNSSTNNSIDTIQGNQSSSTYGATSTVTTTNEIDKAELTVTLNSSLISAATSGTLTFEAFFTEDQKYGITIKAVDETGSELGASDYTIVSPSVIPDNYAGETINITVGNAQNSCYVFDHWAEAPDGPSIETQTTLSATYVAGSAPTTYYAVYKKKTVNIKVTTADDNKGTVRIVTPAPAAPAGN